MKRKPTQSQRRAAPKVGKPDMAKKAAAKVQRSHVSGAGGGGQKNICKNAQCKLRKANCRGFEGCPGFMG